MSRSAASAAPPQRPTYCEIDLSAIARNVRRVRNIVGPRTKVMAVVKANAYGHGALEVARAAASAGAEWLGVAFAAEGLALRNAGLSVPILVLGWTPASAAPEAIANDLTLTVYDPDHVRAYAAIAREQGRRARVHLKVDTGMGRLGVMPQDAGPLARAIMALDGITLEGVFTHFSMSDSSDRSHVMRQLARFQEVIGSLAKVTLIHAANSAAALTLPQSRFDMVRLGIAMYGLHPSDDVPCPPEFEPALAWKSALAQVRTLPPDHPVSYNNEYMTTGYEGIGVVPVGYADGFRRTPKDANEVLIGGRRTPVVGRVCMDQVMVGLADRPEVAAGAEVVIIGRQGDQAITAEEVGRRWGTINYDVTSGIMARVPRVFVG